MSKLQDRIQQALQNGEYDLAQELIEAAKSEHEKHKDHVSAAKTSNSEEKRKSSRQKFDKNNIKINFTDIKSIKSDKKFDKQLKAIRVKSYRPKAPKKVKAICMVCGKSELVHPKYISRTIGDDEIQSYRCNKCCGGY